LIRSADLVWRAACAAASLAAAGLLLGVWGLRARPDPTLRQIALVVVDTLRADRLGLHGHPRDLSPRLDAWAESGCVFERAHATSPWTLPSFASIYTGHYAMRHGAGLGRDQDPPVYVPLDEGVPTVAELLARSGLTTAALTNNPVVSPRFGLSRGFGEYEYEAVDDASTRPADAMVDRALRWLDESRHRSFFLVVHLFDPHLPYDAPPPFRGRYTSDVPSSLTHPFDRLVDVRTGALVPDDADRRFIAGAYDEEVAFVDAQLERLLAELDRAGVLERGLVILTADHGEELFDHGGFEHGHAMWQELLRVPLIIWGRGVPAGRTRAPVSLIDLAPTMLAFAGLDVPHHLPGRALLSRPEPGRAGPERTLFADSIVYGDERKVVLRWPYKLILDPAGSERLLFELEQDPLERTDLAPARPELAEALAAELRDELHDADRRFRPALELDPETAERLRALGYVR
jgi:arylsulfatase A-like enzyme